MIFFLFTYLFWAVIYATESCLLYLFDKSTKNKQTFCATLLSVTLFPAISGLQQTNAAATSKGLISCTI